MFQNGQYVVYSCKGIFQVRDTTTLSLDGISADKLYYVMQPLSKKDSSVYAPVDIEKTNMRAVMTKDYAEEFLHSIDSIELIDIKNNKQRDDAFKACIRSCDPTELMRVIKTLHTRKAERKLTGKKLTVADSHFLEQAEHILLEELMLVLDLDKDHLQQRILSELNIPEAAIA